MHLDFDAVDGWVRPTPAWLTTIQAHSGRYAMVLAHNQVYGVAYQGTWAQFEDAKELRLQMWCWLPHARTKVVVMMECLRDDKHLFYQGLRVTENVRRYGQWEKAQCVFTMPYGMQPTDQVKIYPLQMHDGLEDLYFDDISIDKLK